MVNAAEWAHERLIEEISEDYRRQGYEVTTPESPLSFGALTQYIPDIVAASPEKTLVLEVKSRANNRPLDYWTDLKQAIETQPGWEFHLIVDRGREEDLVEAMLPTISDAELTGRITEAERLAEHSQLPAALLLAWSSLEAILRRRIHQQEIKQYRLTFSALASGLVSEGDLDREDYFLLMEILPVRNHVAHGIQDELTSEIVQQTIALARRLSQSEEALQKVA